MMKHTLILLMLLPVALCAQKGGIEKIIKLPLYNATIPINEVWIDRIDSADKASIAFENPNFEIEKFDLIINHNGGVMRLSGGSNQSAFGLAYYISLANRPNTTVMIHLNHIYLKGNLRPANWTYKVRMR